MKRVCKENKRIFVLLGFLFIFAIFLISGVDAKPCKPACPTGKFCNTAKGTCVNCNSNSQCGTNGYSSLFCQNGNVYQNYTTFTCNYPGTTSSSCSKTATTQLKQTCLSGQTCSNGVCVSNCPPKTCSQLGKSCGNVDNGCGTQINCGTCGSGQTCNNGVCENTPPIILSNNTKDMSKYTNKETFLISDLDWHNVLPLVPVTTWTGNENCQKGYGTPNNVCVYPTLIYHEQEDIKRLTQSNTWIYDNSRTVLGYVNITYRNFTVMFGITDNTFSLTQNGQFNASIGENITFNLNIGNYDSAPKQVNSVTLYFLSTKIDYYHDPTSPYFTVYNKNYSKGEVVIDAGSLYAPKTISLPVTFTFLKQIPMHGYDIDASIEFMQRYSPSRLTLIGEMNQTLINIIASPPSLGVGLSAGQMQKISTSDYFSYWQSFDTVVFVDDNYELALLASTYASLVNAPLVIQGTANDNVNVYSGRNVICVGSSTPSGTSCKAQYNLEQLRQLVLSQTQTKKVIMVNPADLDIYSMGSVGGYRSYSAYNSSGQVYYNMYNQTEYRTPVTMDVGRKSSLVSPFLAAAKHELILSASFNNNSDYTQFDNFLKSKLNQYYGTNPSVYLTIIASPFAIPYALETSALQGYPQARSLDQTQYADINKDFLPDLPTGRITGQSVASDSAYVARDLFYSYLPNPGLMKFMASSYSPWIIEVQSWSNSFSNAGYNTNVITCPDAPCDYNKNDFIISDLLVYRDHGDGSSGATRSSFAPVMVKPITFDDACSTCAFLGQESSAYCSVMINNGAIANIGGAVSVAWGPDTWNKATLNNIYYSNQDIGTAFKNGYQSGQYFWMHQLLGDPAFKPNLPHLLKQSL